MHGQGGAWSLAGGLWAPGDPQFELSLLVACGALPRATKEIPSCSWERKMETEENNTNSSIYVNDLALKTDHPIESGSVDELNHQTGPVQDGGTCTTPVLMHPTDNQPNETRPTPDTIDQIKMERENGAGDVEHFENDVELNTLIKVGTEQSDKKMQPADSGSVEEKGCRSCTSVGSAEKICQADEVSAKRSGDGPTCRGSESAEEVAIRSCNDAIAKKPDGDGTCTTSDSAEPIAGEKEVIAETPDDGGTTRRSADVTSDCSARMTNNVGTCSSKESNIEPIARVRDMVSETISDSGAIAWSVEEAITLAKDRIMKLAGSFVYVRTLSKDPYDGFRFETPHELCKHSLDELKTMAESIPVRFGYEARKTFIRQCYVDGVNPDCWDWGYADKDEPLVEQLPFSKHSFEELKTLSARLKTTMEQKAAFVIYCYRRGKNPNNKLVVEKFEALKSEAWCTFRSVKGKAWKSSKYGKLSNMFPHQNCKHTLTELKILAQQIPDSFGLGTRMKFIHRCYVYGMDPALEDWTQYDKNPYYEYEDLKRHKRCLHSADELKRLAERIPSSAGSYARVNFFYRCYVLGENETFKWNPQADDSDGLEFVVDPFKKSGPPSAKLTDVVGPHPNCRYSLEEIQRLSERIPESDFAARRHFVLRCYRYGHDPDTEQWEKYFQKVIVAYPQIKQNHPYREFDLVSPRRHVPYSFEEIKLMSLDIPDAMGLEARFKFIRRCYRHGCNPFTEDWTQYSIDPFHDIEAEYLRDDLGEVKPWLLENLLEKSKQILESHGLFEQVNFVRKCFLGGANPMIQLNEYSVVGGDAVNQPELTAPKTDAAEQRNVMRKLWRNERLMYSQQISPYSGQFPKSSPPSLQTTDNNNKEIRLDVPVTSRQSLLPALDSSSVVKPPGVQGTGACFSNLSSLPKCGKQPEQEPCKKKKKRKKKIPIGTPGPGFNSLAKYGIGIHPYNCVTSSPFDSPTKIVSEKGAIHQNNPGIMRPSVPNTEASIDPRWRDPDCTSPPPPKFVRSSFSTSSSFLLPTPRIDPKPSDEPSCRSVSSGAASHLLTPTIMSSINKPPTLANLLDKSHIASRGPSPGNQHDPPQSLCSKKKVQCDVPPEPSNPGSSLNDVPIYIMPVDYPFVVLSEYQMDAIENAILESILEMNDVSTNKPSFENSFRCNGRYGVVCNEFTKKWLLEFLKKFHPWPDMNLTIHDPRKVCANAILPQCSDDVEKILKFLAVQNSGLNVAKWVVVDRWDTSDNKTCLNLTVDEDSAKALRNCDRVYFKMGTGKIVLPPKTSSDEDRSRRTAPSAKSMMLCEEEVSTSLPWHDEVTLTGGNYIGDSLLQQVQSGGSSLSIKTLPGGSYHRCSEYSAKQSSSGSPSQQHRPPGHSIHSIPGASNERGSSACNRSYYLPPKSSSDRSELYGSGSTSKTEVSVFSAHRFQGSEHPVLDKERVTVQKSSFGRAEPAHHEQTFDPECYSVDDQCGHDRTRTSKGPSISSPRQLQCCELQGSSRDGDGKAADRYPTNPPTASVQRSCSPSSNDLETYSLDVDLWTNHREGGGAHQTGSHTSQANNQRPPGKDHPSPPGQKEPTVPQQLKRAAFDKYFDKLIAAGFPTNKALSFIQAYCIRQMYLSKDSPSTSLDTPESSIPSATKKPLTEHPKYNSETALSMLRWFKKK